MTEDNYSIVNEIVEMENNDDYHYYYKSWFGKRYCIICNIELTDQDTDKIFSIIRKKERSKKALSFNKKYSCSK